MDALDSHKRKVILVLGKTGAGKTELVKRLRLQASRSITLDPQGEYDGYVVETFSEFVDYFGDHPPRQFRVTCRFGDEIDDRYLFQAVWHVGRCLFVVDDITAFTQSEDFLRLINRGRIKDISLICAAQRVPHFDTDLRAQFSSMVTFAQDAPNDVETLIKWGFDPYYLTTLTRENHRSLGVGEKLEVDYNPSTIRMKPYQPPGPE